MRNSFQLIVNRVLTGFACAILSLPVVAQPAGVGHFDVVADGDTMHLLMGTGKKSGAEVALWHRKSEDGGVTWSRPVRVNQDNDRLTARHPGENPQIVASGKRVLVVWSQPRPEGGHGGLLRTQFSEDGGATWKAGGVPFMVDKGSQILSELAARDGKIHMVWLDGREGRQALRYSSSADGGASWGEAVLVAPQTCSCCWNSIAIGSQGRVSTLFRGAAPRDMMVATRESNGKWGTPQPAGNFGWKFDGCPHAGGGLVDTGAARHALAWTGSEKSGLYHIALRDGASGENLTRLGSDDARNADLGARLDGALVAVWDESSRDGSRIYRAQSTDGVSWSKPEALSPVKSASSFPRVLVTGKGEAVFWLEGSMRTSAALMVNGKPLSL